MPDPDVSATGDTGTAAHEALVSVLAAGAMLAEPIDETLQTKLRKIAVEVTQIWPDGGPPASLSNVQDDKDPRIAQLRARVLDTFARSAQSIRIPMDIALEVFRACPPSPSLYACRGDDDPYRTVGCGVDQCENPACLKDVACERPWHRLPVSTRELLTAARAARQRARRETEPVPDGR